MKRRRLIVLLLFSLLSVTAWGQLPISNLRGISNQPLPIARTQNESHAHTPDSTAADSTAEEGPKGVEYHVVNRRVYIPGLNKLYKSVVKALAFFHRKFIKDSLPVLPLPVRLIEPKAPVTGKVSIILIFMKALLLKAIEQTKSQGHDKDQAEYVLFYAVIIL